MDGLLRAGDVRRRARVDQNHAEIVSALRQAGYSVQSLAAVGRGAPDLLVGAKGTNLLMEVKAPKGKRNVLQERWADTWDGTVHVVRSIEDALMVIWVETRVGV